MCIKRYTPVTAFKAYVTAVFVSVAKYMYYQCTNTGIMLHVSFTNITVILTVHIGSQSFMLFCFNKYLIYSTLQLHLIKSIFSGGLTNYLYVCSLPPEVDVPDNQPHAVLLRVYGSIATSSNFVVQNSVIFALMSEKKLGPKLYGMTPEARIEELVPVRFLCGKTAFCELLFFN